MPEPQDISEQQRDILNRVAACGLPCLPVSILREEDSKTAAESASYSRAVSRLARRGLVRPIVFHDAGPGERANALMISSEALEVLKRHAETPCPGPAPASVAQPRPDVGWHRCESCNTIYQGPKPRFGSARLCPRCIPKAG